MIQLYSWRTPNGRKLQIMLEECGLPYTVHPIDINKGAQFTPEFLKLSPNNKIPAIVDEEGPAGRPLILFESSAILMYLARESGRFLPDVAMDPEGYYTVLQWLIFQTAHIGPSFGQAHHFRLYAKQQVPYGIERFTRESGRLYAILDRRLTESDWLGGSDYSIADIATYPWIARAAWHGVRLAEFPRVQAWFAAIGERPAVQRGMAVLPDVAPPASLTDRERDNLFGPTQYARR